MCFPRHRAAGQSGPASIGVSQGMFPNMLWFSVSCAPKGFGTATRGKKLNGPCPRVSGTVTVARLGRSVSRSEASSSASSFPGDGLGRHYRRSRRYRFPALPPTRAPTADKCLSRTCGQGGIALRARRGQTPVLGSITH